MSSDSSRCSTRVGLRPPACILLRASELRNWTKVQYARRHSTPNLRPTIGTSPPLRARSASIRDGVDGGCWGEINGRRHAIGNVARVAQDRQILAGRLIVRHVARKLTPYQGRGRSLSPLGIDNTQQVARVRLPRIQPQRLEGLVLGVRQHSTPFINESEIEM